MKEVVVTGIGALCSLGIDPDIIWQRLLNGDSICETTPGAWQNYDDFQSHLWSPLPPLDFTQWGFGRLDHMRFDTVSLMSCAAVNQALDHAGFDLVALDRKKSRFSIEGLDAQRSGVFIGTGIGGIHTTLGTHMFHGLNRAKQRLNHQLELGQPGTLSETVQDVMASLPIERRFNPLAVTMLMSNAVAASPAIRFGLSGPVKTCNSACASGTVAIGEAFKAIQSGSIDMAACGGSEFLDDEYGSIFRSYDITGALTSNGPSASDYRGPFDRGRSGFLFSQGGAAALILESEEHARARDARVLARVRSFAESFDAYNMIAMDSDAPRIRGMLNVALGEAGLEANDISYINAHGTGTEQNDAIETAVLGEMFPHGPWINSSKGALGHTIGASGALEAITCVQALISQKLHPCAHLHEPLDSIRLVQEIENDRIEHVLSQSFAFGGHNACLILSGP